jgi:hypothetical protein
VIEFMEGLGKLPQPCRGQHVTDDLDQALDLGVVSQAAHGVRGLAAFDAGGLPRMQQQAVVEQQTQRRFCTVSENPSTVVRFPVTEAEEPPKASYQITRFNALKHGILARLVMLPHEDAGEFADLLAALVEEHRPAGATEAHLVAELAEFIDDHLRPVRIRDLKEVQHQPAIRAQTLGEGLQMHRLEKLSRYETHLDRKFERTLAMLVKLKELR